MKPTHQHIIIKAAPRSPRWSPWRYWRCSSSSGEKSGDGGDGRGAAARSAVVVAALLVFAAVGVWTLAAAQVGCGAGASTTLLRWHVSSASAAAAEAALPTAVARKQLRRAAAAQEPAPFYFITTEEAEQTYPALKECGLTIYAERWHRFFAEHPARVSRLQDAAFALWPGYSAWEENWPHYGNPGANQLRPGKQCFDESLQAALNAAAQLRGAAAGEGGGGRRGPKHLLVLDLYAWGWRQNWTPYYDQHGSNGLVWAKLEPLESSLWRPWLDVSVPPPPHQVVMPVTHLFNATRDELRAAAAWTSPLLDGSSAPPAFAVFRGRFSTNGVRAVLGTLHDPAGGVVIINSEQPPPANATASVGDGSSGLTTASNLTALMAASAYTFAPRGDARWSYRYTEATCSGSVPVVVGADGWRMPLDRLAPFETYGVSISAADAPRAVYILRAIPDARRRALANAARRVCQTWLGSPERIAHAVLAETTQKLAALAADDAGAASSSVSVSVSTG